MCRTHLFASCAVISAFLCGCVGLVVVKTTETILENPTTADTARRDFWLKPRSELSDVENNRVNAFWGSGKSDKLGFIGDWGDPDEMVKNTEGNEEWVYKKKRWCGVVPIFLLPLPLILPVCDGFDRVEFDGDQAISLKSKRSRLHGCIFGAAMGFFGACQ